MRRTRDLLADPEYPTTTEQLIENYGDRPIELSNGAETVGEVLSRLESETFERREDAVYAVYSAVGEGAIGRKGYSDRDPTPLGSPYRPQQLSF